MKTAAVFTVLVMALTACAQDKKPLSPPAKASATVGGKNITIDYSAPSMRGRKIFGELVPYGKVWRTGANSATTLNTEGTLKMGDVTVPPGKYTIYSLPEENGFTLIINKQTGQWGTEYDQSQDLGRVKMEVSHPPAPVETFHISLKDDGGNKGTLMFEWDGTAASVPFTVE